MIKFKCRKNKQGTYSYDFEVCIGTDASGKRIRRFKTWKSPIGMTKRQADKQAELEYLEFLKEVQYNKFAPSSDITFGEYAQTALELKKREGLKQKTLARYHDILQHLNKYIGHIKLRNLSVADLDALYEVLEKEGARRESPKARAKVDLVELLKSKKLSRSKLAERAGLSASTVGLAVAGESVTIETAQKISVALEQDVASLFAISANSSGLSGKTIREYHNLISSVLEVARKKHIVSCNVAKDATPPSFSTPKPEYLQPEEIQALRNALQSAPLMWQLMLFVFLATGARRGEVLSLRWRDYEKDKRILHIIFSLLYTSETGVYEDTTKGDDERFLVLPQQVALMFEEYRRERMSSPKWSDTTCDDNDYIFVNQKGNHLHPDSVNNWLRGFCRRHELKHIYPHMFRHTAVSLLIYHGFDITTVAGHVGHKSPTTTLNKYAHMIAASRAAVGECISDVLFKQA